MRFCRPSRYLRGIRRPAPRAPDVDCKLHTRTEADCDILETDDSTRLSIAEIADLLRRSGASLIAIDGLSGAGKTTIATRLSPILAIRSVHLDHFLRRGSTRFADNLRYDDLRRSLSARPVIVEGVCMLDVLGRLELCPDQLIYLSAPIETLPDDPSHPLVREVRAYADRFHPAERANHRLTRAAPGANRHENRAPHQILVDAYLVRWRDRISFALVAAGMFMLGIGATCIVIGLSGPGEAIPQLGSERSSQVGTGVATVLLSSLWIYFARSSRR